MAGQGRHSEYNAEIGERICALTATHPVGVKALCKLYPDLPDDTTIFTWRLRHDDFGREYARAKQLQAELLAEEIIDIADDSSQDIIYGKHGEPQCNNEFVARSRVRIDSRKWIASKLAPKIYGDRQIIEQTTSENEQLKSELAQLRAELDEKNKKCY